MIVASANVSSHSSVKIGHQARRSKTDNLSQKAQRFNLTKVEQVQEEQSDHGEDLSEDLSSEENDLIGK